MSSVFPYALLYTSAASFCGFPGEYGIVFWGKGLTKSESDLDLEPEKLSEHGTTCHRYR